MEFVWLLRNWKKVLLAITLLGVGSVLAYQGWRLRDLRQERDDLTVKLSSATSQINALRAISKAQNDAIEKNIQNERIENDRTEKIKAFIAAQPDDTGCNLPPVINGTLERMRR